MTARKKLRGQKEEAACSFCTIKCASRELLGSLSEDFGQHRPCCRTGIGVGVEDIEGYSRDRHFLKVEFEPVFVRKLWIRRRQAACAALSGHWHHDFGLGILSRTGFGQKLWPRRSRFCQPFSLPVPYTYCPDWRGSGKIPRNFPGPAGGFGITEMAESMEELRNLFDTFDTDGSGSVTASELEAVLIEMGVQVSQERLRAMIAEVDGQ